MKWIQPVSWCRYPGFRLSLRMNQPWRSSKMKRKIVFLRNTSVSLCLIGLYLKFVINQRQGRCLSKVCYLNRNTLKPLPRTLWKKIKFPSSQVKERSYERIRRVHRIRTYVHISYIHFYIHCVWKIYVSIIEFKFMVFIFPRRRNEISITSQVRQFHPRLDVPFRCVGGQNSYDKLR